ncbi:MAG TPA: thiamine phosphate synthase [Verrucomicrobiae bacterium]|jgi:thiamine-phosphate pyrophosphorylase
MKAFGEASLYTFVDTAYLHGRNPIAVTEQLCEGGSDVIQLRAKKETRSEVVRMAEAILPITRAAQIPLVINDYADVARETGAECVHLGQEDFFDAGLTHRSHFSPLTSHLGLSSHSPKQAARAIAAGADYIAIGPVFATETKPGRAPVTLECVRWAAANVRIPWFAIGGISLENLDAVLAAGARRICVVSAILNAPDIAQACRTFKKRLAI